MCVCSSHGCGGFVGAGMEVVIGRHAGKDKGLVECREMSEDFLCAK